MVPTWVFSSAVFQCAECVDDEARVQNILTYEVGACHACLVVVWKDWLTICITGCRSSWSLSRKCLCKCDVHGSSAAILIRGIGSLAVFSSYIDDGPRGCHVARLPVTVQAHPLRLQ
jgi:hypothetical protein